MYSFLFRLIPWWMFAFAATSMASLTFAFFEDYQRDQEMLQRSILAGPPDVVRVDQMGRMPPTAFQEVRVDGTLRADLGVQNIYFSETQYNYVVLDGNGTGPLVAILIPASEAASKLTSLVNAADRAGRVTMSGFLAPSRVGEVSRRLAQRHGISRELFVVEPYFGSRADALTAEASDSQWVFFISLGITALLALVAFVRFRGWRKRRATRRGQRPRPAPQPAQSQATPVSQTPRAEASPWGSFGGGIGAAKPAATPAAPPPAKAAPTAKGKAKPKKPTKTRKPKKGVPQPPFESVFPGSTSQFRFKSADDIIRQSFGGLTALSRVNSDD